jgi:outer membrane lipoprotein SlyB
MAGPGTSLYNVRTDFFNLKSDMMNIKKISLPLVFCCAMLVGCSGDEFSGNRYTAANVGEAARTDAGTIISLRKVEIKPDGSVAGTALGAVGGGIVGSMFGGGHAKYATAAAGAVAGGVAGHALTSRPTEGVEYTVKLETGSLVTIAQGPTPALSVGQKVYIVNSEKGKSRIVAA